MPNAFKPPTVKNKFLNWPKRLLKSVPLLGYGDFSLYDLLELYVVGILKGALTTRAGSISFSFFMALFPFLLFILHLLPWIPIQNFNDTFLNFVESLVPATSVDFFDQIYEGIAAQNRGGVLSWTFILSILLIGNGINAVFGGFEDSIHINISRNMIKQYLYALGVGLLLALLLIVISIGFLFFEIYVVQNLTDFGVLESDQFGVTVGKILFLSSLAFLSTAILYYFGTAEGKKVSFFSPGAIMTVLLFLLTTYFFGIYVERFSTYDRLYGSIGALLILMLYIWLNAIVLLLGFELNAVLARLKRAQ